jgi:hypothetical protein
MTYCSVNKVRLVSGLESHDINDGEIRELRDEVATEELVEDINQKVQDQQVNRRISGEKENDIDGSNKTFYLRGPHNSELMVGDRNGDGRVDASDLNVYQIDQENNRVENLNVVLEDKSIGKITVEKSNGDALENGSLYASYVLAPVDQDGYQGNDFSSDGPDRLMETACAQLTAAYAFTNVDASKLKDFSVGNVTINSQSEGASIMRNEYRETLRRINQTQVIQTGQNENTVEGAFTR